MDPYTDFEYYQKKNGDFYDLYKSFAFVILLFVHFLLMQRGRKELILWIFRYLKLELDLVEGNHLKCILMGIYSVVYLIMVMV